MPYEASLTGDIAAWGYNAQYQCNVPSGNDFVAISGGGRHSLALRSDFEARINNLIDRVNILADEVGLNKGEANALIKKLENALKSLEKENIQLACNQLGAFIYQVNALINSGRLTPEQGQELIDAAQSVINGLCG